MEAEFSEKIQGLNGPSAKHNATHRYRPEIDGLRAIAIVAVIINHFNSSILPGGFLGVDIFFVISGYVITKSLQRIRIIYITYYYDCNEVIFRLIYY